MTFPFMLNGISAKHKGIRSYVHHVWCRDLICNGVCIESHQSIGMRSIGYARRGCWAGEYRWVAV